MAAPPTLNLLGEISLIIELAAYTLYLFAYRQNAIAAPTPVSALVHSSTLVTAGVYLLIRFNILFLNSYISRILLLISGLTIFIAGLGANFEFDLKKIIALSTLRQLGLIIRILSIGYGILAFFHLLTHALFKALLFICAGVIIHCIKNIQDIRFIGNLRLRMPLVRSCFNIANLALCGIPFLAGFYSKDLILEIVSLSYLNFFSFFLFFSTGLTVCYSFRLVYYLMGGEYRGISINIIRRDRLIIIFGIFWLIIITIIGGSILNWLVFFNPSIICLPFIIKILVLLVCIIGGLIGYLIRNISLNFLNKSLYFYNFR
ncbi:NADH-ubiquinone oxidoreductase chain 5-like [Malaya genurostris]|uniref:NADH-ubiquinone oxidoreductase chain 5-like n=1 Tax=Malaya genurostris TaxID=325434 RepID=UPI0026F3FFA8|nr:NADH-ubiquinone oxidoreductase chain 5-like [Malaya genurostris]